MIAENIASTVATGSKPGAGDGRELWMLDSASGGRQLCRWLSTGPNHVKLLVARGSHFSTGDHVRLCSHLSGQSAPIGAATMNCPATVIQVCECECDSGAVEVDLDFDPQFGTSHFDSD